MVCSKLISFEIGTVHSNKKNADYYALFIICGNVKQVVAWLTKEQYDQIRAKLS